MSSSLRGGGIYNVIDRKLFRLEKKVSQIAGNNSEYPWMGCMSPYQLVPIVNLYSVALCCGERHPFIQPCSFLYQLRQLQPANTAKL